MHPQHVLVAYNISIDATILNKSASNERIFIPFDLPLSSQCHSTFALRIRINFIISYSFRLRGSRLLELSYTNFMAQWLSRR